tara:strand:- start:50021 stop:50227 length:207 start_codon:yes stop_codon:yes gene_type:complete
MVFKNQSYWIFISLSAPESIPIFSDNNLEPLFFYFYDDQVRMIEEVELYTEYGFSLLFKTIYSYGQSN